MKKYIILLLVFMVASCNSSVEENIVPSSTDSLKVDSLISVNNLSFEELTDVQKEVDSSVKNTILKYVSLNTFLKEKITLTKATIIHDTVFIKEVQTKNFWGKTKKTEAMVMGVTTQDTVETMAMEAMQVDTVGVEADTTLQK